MWRNHVQRIVERILELLPAGSGEGSSTGVFARRSQNLWNASSSSVQSTQPDFKMLFQDSGQLRPQLAIIQQHDCNLLRS